MTSDDLDACLADLGLTEGGFAKLIGAEVAQVKRWRSGDETIPAWAPMVLSLFSEFREGARTALEGGGIRQDQADAAVRPGENDSVKPN